MPEIRVEKNLPIPQRGGRPPKYPWPSMDVGDSFLVECETGTERYESTKVLSCGNTWSKRNRDGQWRFCTRTVKGGIRVWRVE